jgi:hypothetical protein
MQIGGRGWMGFFAKAENLSDLGVPAKKTEKKYEPPWATQILNQ